MAVKVIVKNKGFDGIRGGVKFNKGVGIFEDDAQGKELARFLGYEIEPIEAEKPAKKAPVKKAVAKKAPVKKETKAIPTKPAEAKEDKKAKE